MVVVVGAQPALDLVGAGARDLVHRCCDCRPGELMGEVQVTPVTVETRQFVAPAPPINWRELPNVGGGFIPTPSMMDVQNLGDRISYLERCLDAQAMRIDQLEDILIKAGILEDTRP